MAMLASMIVLGKGDPAPVIEPTTIIAPTTNLGQGVNLNPGLYGLIYNFNSNAPTINDPDYTFAKILNNVTPTSHASLPFNPVLVASYVANTTDGINYGTVNHADSQPLTTWLGADGATVHPTTVNPVFNTVTQMGTLLDLKGYIKITPAMVNVPQDYQLAVDDGGILTINGTTVIDKGGIHGIPASPPPPIYPVIFTRAGIYSITVGYYDGDPVKAEMEANFGGGELVATPNGAPVIFTPLDPTASTVQNYVDQVAGTMPTDPTFNNAANALANLAFAGGDPAPYENALKELSPLKYAGLDSQTVGTIDFITNDLDDYLSHRRTDAGTFRPGNGIDLSGLSVFDGNTDPALQDIAGRLLAFNGADHAPETLSDTPESLIPATDPKPDQHWNVFTRGIVVLSQNLSGGGLQHSNATSGTLQLGADYQVSPHFLAGAFFDYARSSASLDEEGSSASANSYIPGLYASYTEGGWYGNALAAGGVSNFDVTRHIVLPGFAASARANPDGEEEYGYISGGRDFHFKNWTIGPTAGLQYVHANNDAFTESGAGLLDLNVNSHDNDSLRSRLGGRIYFAAPYETVLWRPFLDASWQHEFMENNNSFTAQFDGAGVGAFTVAAPSNSRDTALISAGSDIDIDKDTTVFTAYRVEVGASNFFAQSVEAGVKITF